MTADYEMTPEEYDIIEGCCAWLDDETIEMCHLDASCAADQITQPEIAEHVLRKTMFEIAVRNRRAAMRT